MFDINFTQLLKGLGSTKGKSSESVKETSTQKVDSGSSFQKADIAASSYGVASVKIASQTSKKVYTPEQVERILKDFLKNDKYDISMYSELFSNLDKLDYENIDRHLENIKTLMSGNVNSPNGIVKKGYFYSKEGADAFDALSGILSSKSSQGFVSPLSIALGNYDPKTVLILKKRGLLNPVEIDNSHRLNKFANMNDEEYENYQARVDESIAKTGRSFESLSTELKFKTKGMMRKESFSFFEKNYIHRETVVPQLEILKEIKNYPVVLKDYDLEALLSDIDIDNVESYKNMLKELKKRPDLDVNSLLGILSQTNNKTEKIISELLSDENTPILKIVEYCKKEQDFKKGIVGSSVILDKINNDPFLKTVRAIKNSNVDLVPTNTNPTPLNPRNIDSNSLMLVHMTKYQPENGMILSTRDKLGGSRNSVHFTLNHAVTEHRGGSWDICNYALIMPYESTCKTNADGKFIEGMPNDLYTNGSVKIPEGSVIVKYNPELEAGKVNITDYEGIKGVKLLESSMYPHDIVPSVIEKMGYSHMQADGPIGMFSYGKNKGNDIDDAIKNYSAWKTFCDSNGIKPTRHTGSAGDIAEKVIESVGKLCVNNTWIGGRNNDRNYKKELLGYLETIKSWEKMGYFVSYDIDAMSDILKNSSTPKIAVKTMEEKLGFHPTIDYKTFPEHMFGIPMDIYSTWHDMSDNLSNLRKYLIKYEI